MSRIAKSADKSEMAPIVVADAMAYKSAGATASTALGGLEVLN